VHRIRRDRDVLANNANRRGAFWPIDSRTCCSARPPSGCRSWLHPSPG